VFALISLGISATAVAGGTQSLKALIPWNGEGRVYNIGADTMLFLGSFKGVVYAEKAGGELDEGFVECPITQKINIKTQATSGSGHCMVTVSETKTVYAEWTCKGKVGGCTGDFKITNGTGGLEGITGSSKLVIRSPLNVLVADMSDGSVVRAATGIAILPELKYQVPAK
jgi:hypothetical protein